MKKINHIFIDRDGVINKRLPGAYVRLVDEFEWLPGVLDAFAYFNEMMDHVLVVTNQQGIGKGLMTEAELTTVHAHMLDGVKSSGGRIDRIYHCPDIRSKENNCRKPNPKMALMAQQHYPEINFAHSMMIGDSVSDILFGQNAGMMTALVTTNAEETLSASKMSSFPDLIVDSLWDVAQWIRLNL